MDNEGMGDDQVVEEQPEDEGTDPLRGWDRELVEALRAEHGTIRHGRIGTAPPFLWREPKWSNMEIFSQSAKRSSLNASRQLLAACIVHPHRREVMPELKSLALGVMAFVDSHVCPLAGMGAPLESSVLK